MTEEKLRLRYIEDTDTIMQVWFRFPYLICVALDRDGTMHEVLIEKTNDEYI